MAYRDLYLELVGTFPDLPVQQAKRFINRAQRDAYDAWNWSFLAGDGELNIPDSVNDGAITLTQNSQVVIADATAAAAWNALGLFIPITARALKLGTDQPYQILAYDGVDTAYIDRPWPNESTGAHATASIAPGVAGNPIDGTFLTIGPTEVFVWVNVVVNPTDVLIGGTTAISFQNMVDVINTNTATATVTAELSGTSIILTANDGGTDGNDTILTINDATYGVITAFSGGTATSTYTMYRPYYAAPTDFQRWVSIVDTTDAWNLIPGKKKDWLDWIDPQRSTIGGPAQFVSFFKLQRAMTIPAFGTNTSTTALEAQQLFELWPGPTAAMSLTTYYKKRGADMVSDTDTSPFDDGLLLARALYHTYRFVQANQVRFMKTTGKGVNWAELKRDANTDYMYELGNAIKRDDNINLASVLNSPRGWYPSSSWLSRHLTWSSYSQAYASSYFF